MVVGLLAAFSCCLYIVFPDQTVITFGGKPTLTTNTWVPIVAAGDGLCAFLLLYSAIKGSGELKRVLIFGMGVFSAIHIGGFIRGHIVNEKQPAHFLVGYAVALLSSVAGIIWWGILHPPTDLPKVKHH